MRAPIGFLLVTVLCVSLTVCSADSKIQVDRPRGVPLARKPLYDPTKDFSCLDGSGTVPFSYVNDDYCDCKDGTDEPGTAACALGKFNCVNLGHHPMNIPSSRVNDQICDCCDGSDEWNGLVTCPNICDEIGRVAREEAARKAELYKEGYDRRQELIKEAEKMKTDKQKQLNVFKDEKDALDPQRDELDLKKQDIEKRENEAKDKFKEAWKAQVEEKKKQRAIDAFNTMDLNQDKQLTINEIQARLEFDKDMDGTVSPEEASYYLLGKQVAEMEHFLEDLWDGIKPVYMPEGFQPTVTEPPEAKEEDEAHTNVTPPTPTTPAPMDGEDDEHIPGEEEDYQEDKDEEVVEGDEVEDFDSEKYMKEGEKKLDEEEEVMPDYDEETKALIEEADAARKEYDEVDTKFKNAEAEIKKLEEFLNEDFGPDGSFAALKDTCVELTDSQYTYKLCMFQKTTQKDRNGGGETSLGNWDKWDGPDDDKYSVQMYSRGQSCWNGPERSTKVRISCGSETKIISASEPGRCEYEFEVETPAACHQPHPPGHLGDEL